MNDRGFRMGRTAGALLQGSALGVLVFLALMKLIESSSHAQIFRYQGF